MATAKAAVLIGLCLGPAGAPGRQEQVPVELTRLELDLSVDYDRRKVAGTATLTVRNVSDRPAPGIPLILNRLMTVSAVLSRTGAPVPFSQGVVLFQDDSSRQVNAIQLSPPAPLAPGDSLTVAVRYGGILTGYTETGSLYIRDRVSPEFTIIREDAYAFPTVGVPSIVARRSAPRAPFEFAIRVRVPAEQVVATGGEPEPPIRQDSTVVWRYRSGEPVPFLNIAIAPYAVRDGSGSRIFSFPADSAGAEMVERAIAGALDRFTRWYGSLGRKARVTVIEIPDGFGSQASLSAGIIQTAAAFRDRTGLPQLYHELSHVWNVPDLDRPSPRWNEGLASFLQYRIAVELDGWAGWDGIVARNVERARLGCPPSPCDAIPLAGYGDGRMTDRSYPVGMLMFYALYQTLGAETFDRAYREFFQRYQVTGGTTRDLADTFRRMAPGSERVLADWLWTTGWLDRLRRGESLAQMIESYRR